MIHNSIGIGSSVVKVPNNRAAPTTQLPSKKRSEARRRRDLVTDVGRQIALAIASWTRGENGLHSTAA
jgi:hypothetical protein